MVQVRPHWRDSSLALSADGISVEIEKGQALYTNAGSKVLFGILHEELEISSMD